MSGDDTSTYAPKSPDLSSFFSTSPTAQPQAQSTPPPPSQDHASYQPHLDYRPASPPSYAYAANSSYAPPHHHLPQPHLSSAGQHHQPIKPEYHQGYPAPVEQHQPQIYHPSNPHAPPPPQPGYDYGLQHQPYQSAPYGQPFAEQQPYAGAPYTQPYAQAPHPGSPSTQAQQLQVKAEPQADAEMPPRRTAPPPAPVLEPSPVRTKFPTARIKRIMQADEEVGKVAQQTPIAVGKALEMFMIQMVTKSAEVAKDKGSKRVNAQMLKQVVETDEQWDFLREIVGRVEAEKEGSKSKAKIESESEEEIPEPKKKVRGGRRKKE